jgi:hypothetical protein
MKTLNYYNLPQPFDKENKSKWLILTIKHKRKNSFNEILVFIFNTLKISGRYNLSPLKEFRPRNFTEWFVLMIRYRVPNFDQDVMRRKTI